MNIVSTRASRKGHPYYIYAPAYRESSAGIVVMHTLCHLLNREGYDAYISATDVVNPRFDTPLATFEVQARHRLEGRMPIVVYPEIVSGNPMNADVCVRYILNHIGFLSGKPLNEGKDDLVFYFSENFLGSANKKDVDFLFLPVIDTELFKPDPTVKKDRTFVFHYRHPLDKIDFSLFPPGTELLSMANPVTLPELAKKLQGGRVLYSYEQSSVCNEAMACGCPVIYLPEGGLKAVPDQFAFGVNGAAMANEKNGYARALATVDTIYPTLVALGNVFRADLPVFLEKTQDAARKALRRPAELRVASSNVPKTPKRRIAALTTEPVAHRWSTSRVKKPFELLADHWELIWPIQNTEEKIASADIVLMQRRFPMAATPEQLEAIFGLGKPVIYETNEPYHDLPETHPLHFLSRRAGEKVEYVMRRANALIVTTPALAEAMRPWNGNIHVLPTGVDFDRFYSPVRMNEDKVRIGIMGSATKPCNFAVIEPALMALRARFAGDVQFVFVGAPPPPDWMGQPDVTLVGVAETYEEHAKVFRQLELDIGLMPRAASEVDNGEARTEWLEYAAAGVATLGSEHPAYSDLVRDACSGVRVDSVSADAWVTAIANLITNPAQRRSLARTAQAIVYKSGSVQSQLAQYHEVYLRGLGLKLGGASASGPERIPAVLILDPEGDARKVQDSLRHHARGPLRNHMTVVLTTQEGEVPEWSDNLRYLQATVGEFSSAMEQICGHDEFDWKVVTEAGVELI
ncbi:glycosyltransferase [Caballeronia sp. LP006]|uniref:glycosyltransferase n=1 Tax=Caballeronia sp. LP006 TaxID=3038552 RepID=UPI00285E3AF0|nr:glycosyltransferase [Caballeronia sp. LP006]MDR5829788.1 glycosyltransferase [Caballeronia sp. LP006]